MNAFAIKFGLNDVRHFSSTAEAISSLSDLVDCITIETYDEFCECYEDEAPEWLERTGGTGRVGWLYVSSEESSAPVGWYRTRDEAEEAVLDFLVSHLDGEVVEFETETEREILEALAEEVEALDEFTCYVDVSNLSASTYVMATLTDEEGDTVRTIKVRLSNHTLHDKYRSQNEGYDEFVDCRSVDCAVEAIRDFVSRGQA